MRMRLLPVALMAALLCIPACGGSGGGTPPAPGNALGPQLAQISVALDGTVTVTTQPGAFTLSGTAVYDAMAMTLVISLNVRNDFHRLLFNLKAITTSVSDGTQSGSTFPGMGGLPYTYYGPEALDVGADRTEDITLTGLGGMVDPVVLDLSLEDAPMVFGHRSFKGFDTSFSGESFNLGIGLDEPRQGVITPDGRWIIQASKTDPALTVVDTTTFTSSLGTDLSGGGIGSVGGVALSPDGSLVYAAYNDGVHHRGSADDGDSSTAEPCTLDIIEFDVATLTEIRRTNIFTNHADGLTCKALHLSPDGTKLAAVVSGNDPTDENTLWLLDRASMTIIDADAGTMGDQGIDLGGTGDLEFGVWVSNTRFVAGYNGYRWGGPASAPLADVDTVAFTSSLASLVPTTGGETSSAMAAYAGRLYYTSRESATVPFEIFDLTGAMPVQTQPSVITTNEASGVVIHPDGSRYYVINRDGVDVFDLATDTPIDTDNDAGNGVTPFVVSNWKPHFLLISPF